MSSTHLIRHDQDDLLGLNGAQYFGHVLAKHGWPDAIGHAQTQLLLAHALLPDGFEWAHRLLHTNHWTTSTRETATAIAAARRLRRQIRPMISQVLDSRRVKERMASNKMKESASAP